jgi:hypothetical protein
MVSGRKLNKCISKLRGLPVSNIDAYARPISKADMFPSPPDGKRNAPLKPIHASLLLFGTLRHSPKLAADNAHELGQLVPHFPFQALGEPMLGLLPALGWNERTTFAEAFASLINKASQGTIHEIAKNPLFAGEHSISVEVDLYRPNAKISIFPSDNLEKAWRDHLDAQVEPEIKDLLGPEYADGYLVIPFASPGYATVRETFFDGDAVENRNAWRDVHSRNQFENAYDRNGKEIVTIRTIEVLGKLFEDNDGGDDD